MHTRPHRYESGSTREYPGVPTGTGPDLIGWCTPYHSCAMLSAKNAAVTIAVCADEQNSSNNLYVCVRACVRARVCAWLCMCTSVHVCFRRACA